MPRKSLSCEITRGALFIVTAALVLYAVPRAGSFGGAKSATPTPESSSGGTQGSQGLLAPPAKYLGAASCASSGCHGGGGQDQNQFLVWSLRDFHSQRPFATLTTARSKQIADALQIKDAVADTRCTSCHAPLHEVPAALRAPEFRVSEAVSCESCHGPAENWLRSHTRSDYTYAHRVTSGMRDLKNLYVRANTCVACHQNVAQPLLRAGHPELIFELDGQCVSQPKHWREKTNWHGAQAWLVGQAVALREMSWHLTREPEERLAARADAIYWLLRKVDGQGRVPSFGPEGDSGQHAARQALADKLARAAAEAQWTAEMTSTTLAALANSAEDFRTDLPVQQHALRAERLVLALDRLVASSGSKRADTELNDLFKLTQSLPDFDPARFAARLEAFTRALK